ncbi:MAG: glycosyltransferase [Planctomycetota bacterium]|nr:glycosyltransferase [Planctomycetota bacterium]
MASKLSVGVVVIGRNEGERLVRCLQSLSGRAANVVYVDSGSEDGSPERARQIGAVVHELDPSTPFSAARGRNEGFARLVAIDPRIDAVQFVDGDCEVDPGWLDAAAAELDSSPELGIVCGRLRERFPDRTVYNRLCDMEWNGPVGAISRCGGIFMIRAKAFAQVGGFSADLIAGEEGDLCTRVAGQGWRIFRLDRLMAWHDAAMERFGQWWKRSVRAGHAYAEGAVRTGDAPHRPNVREVRRALGWGFVAPMVALLGVALVPLFPPAAVLTLLVALALGLVTVRTYLHRRRRNDPARHAMLYAFFCTLGKLPEAVGVASYWLNRLRGRRVTIIEHKITKSNSQTVAPSAPSATPPPAPESSGGPA